GLRLLRPDAAWTSHNGECRRKDAIQRRCEHARSSIARSRRTARPQKSPCCASLHSCSAAVGMPRTSNHLTLISTIRRSSPRMPATILMAPCGSCQWKRRTSSPLPARRRNAALAWRSLSPWASTNSLSKCPATPKSASLRSTSSAKLRGDRRAHRLLIKENTHASVSRSRRYRRPHVLRVGFAVWRTDPERQTDARFLHPRPAVALRVGGRGRLFRACRRERGGRPGLWIGGCHYQGREPGVRHGVRRHRRSDPVQG